MLVSTQDEFNSMVEQLVNSSVFAFDTETTGLLPYHNDRAVGISFARYVDGGVTTWYVDLRSDFIDKRLLKMLFATHKSYLAWNAKFDAQFLYKEGIVCGEGLMDAMVLTHLHNENLLSYALKTVAKMFLGTDSTVQDEQLKKELKSRKLDKGSISKLPVEIIAPYAEADASLTLRLGAKMIAEFSRTNYLNYAMQIMEYVRVLWRTEQNGVKIDIDGAAEEIERVSKYLTALKVEMAILRDNVEFNPLSVKDVREALGITVSNKEVLESLNNPFADKILEYRGLTKALSTFYGPLHDKADANGRVHTSYRVHGTVSGRLSSADPNLQQLPRKGAKWHHAREYIIAEEGFVLAGCDLSQAELRMLAHYSRDPFLIDAYTKELDIHQMVADQLGIDRQSAKTLNFAIVYGAGSVQLSKLLSVSIQEAEKVLTGHRKLMPRVGDLARSLQRDADNYGQITMWSGRRRHYRVSSGKYIDTHTAMNNIIQGGVAEIVRIAMCKVEKILPPSAKMICQIHDEILLEVREDEMEEACQILKTTLENVHHFRVPIIAEPKAGKNLASMRPL